MSTSSFQPPEFERRAFNCPHCTAYAEQVWFNMYVQPSHGGNMRNTGSLRYAQCTHCTDFSVWLDGKIIYPEAVIAPPPNSDLPPDIQADYEEAASIITRSPRGAAALLRLCLQKLCQHLGQPGKDLNKDIAALVKQGLNPSIQQSLDIVRVIGNEAVHPGQLDLRDKQETSVHLCRLINIIADAMITQPKLIKELYEGLPETKRDQIQKRDATSGT